MHSNPGPFDGAPHLPERPARHGDPAQSGTWAGIRTHQTKITGQAALFHQKNPHVYEILVALAREWIHRTGRKRCSIAMLFESARWELGYPTEAPLALNNNLRAFYSRLIMENEPDLKGLFETRRRAEDPAPRGRRGSGYAEQGGAEPNRLGQPARHPCAPDRPVGRADPRRPKDNRP